MVSRAGVTNTEFYEIFQTVEECYLAAFDHAVARVKQVVADAAAAERHWLERIRTGLGALLGFFAAEPDWARLLTTPPPVAQGAVRERRSHAIRALAVALDELDPGERLTADSAARSSALTAELIVRGVLSLIEAHMLDGDAERLERLQPALMAFIVAPYLGVVAARVELEQKTAGSQNRHPSDPRLTVRTTYRTSRVLQAISATPRSSNREIADAAGLTDEGQTSKLLARLERQGLVENVGLGSAHGEPNAWLLTRYGRQLAKGIRDGFAVSPTVQGHRRIRGAA